MIKVTLPAWAVALAKRAGTGGRRGYAAAGIFVVLLSQSHGATAAPMQIYAAGSLNAAMQALIAASGLSVSAFAKPVYGPAGLLRDRLTKGETADLFASADMAQPLKLAATKDSVLVVPFANNRMCVVSAKTTGLTADNLLDRLLDPKLRLATSTPLADPGGDYALAVFARAERIKPGSASILTTKALHLLGAPNTMVPIEGKSPASAIFLGNHADALLYYCSSSTGILKEVEGLTSLPLPEALEVHPTYGLAVLSDNPDAARFALFVVSVSGQDILSRFGFLPLAPIK